MTEFEALTYAAKAAGIVVGDVFYDIERDTIWDPLNDDGDALRLAVKLEIEPKFLTRTVQAVAIADQDGDAWETLLAEEQKGSDPYAATRRAIVFAAAEIGKAMP